jgi:hypothetical protein
LANQRNDPPSRERVALICDQQRALGQHELDCALPSAVRGGVLRVLEQLKREAPHVFPLSPKLGLTGVLDPLQGLAPHRGGPLDLVL